jgi:hypothetical protein
MQQLPKNSKSIPLQQCPVCGQFSHYKCLCTHMCRRHGNGTTRRLDCKDCQLKGQRGLGKLKYTDASGSNPQNPSEGGMFDGVGAAAAAADAGYIWITDLMEESEQPAEAAANVVDFWITDLMEEESAQPTSLEDMSTEELEAFLALANQE